MDMGVSQCDSQHTALKEYPEGKFDFDFIGELGQPLQLEFFSLPLVRGHIDAMEKTKKILFTSSTPKSVLLL